MDPEQRVRYIVIERYHPRRRGGPAHRIAVFDTAEEADVELRALRRRSPTVTVELLGVDPTGRLTALWASP